MPESNLNKGENTRQQMSFPNRKPTDYGHDINSTDVVFDAIVFIVFGLVGIPSFVPIGGKLSIKQQ
jgi:hypothetical protein